MKTRLFALIAIVVCLFSAGLAVASGGEPPRPAAWPLATPLPPIELPPAAHPEPGGQVLSASGVGASAVPALGRPGTNFRHVQTFGTTDVGYVDDTSHLNNPTGIGTDGTNVWIVEGDGRRALKYTSGGGFVAQIGRAGFQQGMSGTVVSYMQDVAVDGGGNTWLVDQGAHHVMKFDASGTLVSELGSTWNNGTGSDQFDSPSSIAFDGAGNIYISDTNNHRVQVFDSTGANLSVLGESGVSGNDNAHFNGPMHITIAGTYLYVADANNHRVQIFDISNPVAPSYSGTLGTSGVSGADNAHFNSPQGVAVDTSGMGRIFVADGYNNRVQVFVLMTRTYQSTLSGFSFVADVAVDSARNLYVAEPWLSQVDVQQFNSSLTFVRRYGTYGMPYLTDNFHYNRPAAVAAASDGSLYLGESNGRRVVKLNASGAVQWVQGVAGVWGSDNNQFAQVEGLALDMAGRVYVADAPNHRVQIYTAGGVYVATLGQTNTSGTGINQFNRPDGVAVDPGGTIYVADTGNQRVQVFNSARAYVATIGEPGVTGTDNAHFNWPVDVATDSAGNLYVVDQNNHRVQIFNSSRTYIRTLGESGVSGDDLGHFNYPQAVAVDSSGRTYVADQWGSRVQVFDYTGGYLTTVASWGWGTSCVDCLDNGRGLAADAGGNLYIADMENHRVEKYTFGVPGWWQSNINGFGDPLNGEIMTIAPFSAYLYAGTDWWGSSGGAQLWRTGDGVSWSPVVTDGFGAGNLAIDRLLEFNGRLYASTTAWDPVASQPPGGQIWRSDNGLSWTNVITGGFGDPNNGDIYRMAVLSDTLYASTWSYTTTRGAQIYSTPDGLNWTNVMTNGFGIAANRGIVSMAPFGGYLYASTWGSDAASHGQVWRTPGDSTWAQVNADSFNSPGNTGVMVLVAFDGYLYAGTRNWTSGAQIWRCQSGTCHAPDRWEQVATNGFGNPQNGQIMTLCAFGDQLYAVADNPRTGLEVWRTGNGTDWEPVGFSGFSDRNNQYSWGVAAVFNNRLFIGTYNGATGGEIWQKAFQVFLPLAKR